MKVFHSKDDLTANSLSSVLIYRGLITADGGNIDIQIMDSDIHVYTRLIIRDDEVTPLTTSNQIDAFTHMAQKLSQ